MRIARPVVLNQIVSPYGISILSTGIFLVAWFFPAGLYSRLIREPDLMFLDPETLIFFLLCVAGFWAGLLLIDFVFPSRPLLESSERPARLTYGAVIVPLVITTLMTAVACVQLVRETPDLLLLLVSQQGQLLKHQLGEVKLGVIGWGADLQQPVLWWAYWRLSGLRDGPSSVSRLRVRLYWAIFAIGFLSAIAMTIVQVSRDEMMSFLGGFAVVYLMRKISRREIRVAGIVRNIVVLLLVVLLLFVSFALLRGTRDMSGGIGDFVGYTLASYNRLTALLHGTMHYPYGGHGIYLVPFLNANHVVNSIFPFNQVFQWPDFYSLWNSEFVAPQVAGLNDYLIWSGTFGYLFADAGWFTPFVVAGYGLIYGAFWSQMKSGTALGLTVYPWLAFSALAWFSANRAFNGSFPFFLAAGLLLMAYEKLMS